MEEAAQINTTLMDRRWFIRLLEIIPGAITWLFLLSPIILSLFAPYAVAYFIIAYDLFWLIKSVRMSYHLISGYSRMHRLESIDWKQKVMQLSDLDGAVAEVEQKINALLQKQPKARRRLWFGTPRQVTARRQYQRLANELAALAELRDRQTTIIDPRQLYQAVIIATYNESREILEPSVAALAEAEYPSQQIMLIIAYEERGGAQVERNAQALVKKYGRHFALAMAIKHPDGIAGEVRGKGGNITYAGRQLTEEVQRRGIDPEHVIVTTFDADHKPGRHYFNRLAYEYATNVNRVRRSFQPIPMFYNNIWDAPAPMRVVATTNSFWQIMESMRPHRLRNFAAHAQGLKSLIETDYWSVTTIVEDGHQYWRTWFTYDGDHQVVPLYTPVYQDAVLAETYLKTYKAQYLQLRRWAWGVSDFPFVVRHEIRNFRIPLGEKLLQTGRLFEGHFSWATSSLILTFVAWLPLYLNYNFSRFYLAHELPIIASRILTLAMVVQLCTVLISYISLPPKPKRYRSTRRVVMLLQWVLAPIISIVFGSFAAIDAQTRLMFGRYLEFRVTEKVRKG